MNMTYRCRGTPLHRTLSVSQQFQDTEKPIVKKFAPKKVGKLNVSKFASAAQAVHASGKLSKRNSRQQVGG